VIQADIEVEEFHNSIPTEVNLLGEINAIAGQLAQSASGSRWLFPKEKKWWGEIKTKIESNRKTVNVSFMWNWIPSLITLINFMCHNPHHKIWLEFLHFRQCRMIPVYH